MSLQLVLHRQLILGVLIMKLARLQMVFLGLAMFLGTKVAVATDIPLVDGFPRDSILAEQQFRGALGPIATAALVRQSQDEVALMILHSYQHDVRTYLAVSNSRLGLDWGWEFSGSRPSLTVNQAGSLLVNHRNDMGRDRWARTLTIAYRDGAYRLVGFTYEYFDAVNGYRFNCDYNLLTGRGVKNGLGIAILPISPLLAGVDVNQPKLSSCDGW